MMDHSESELEELLPDPDPDRFLPPALTAFPLPFPLALVDAEATGLECLTVMLIVAYITSITQSQEQEVGE